jgi:branched-chain amino acid transport system substrate-binding protein
LKRTVLLLVLVSVLVVAAVAVAACGSGASGESTSSTAAGSESTASTAAPATSSTAAAATGAPFKFGVAGPMTGQYANYGTSHKEGAQIAIDELNAAGGVNGGQASFVLGDDLGDPKQAVLVAQQFIDDKSLVFVDGHQFSGATIAAGTKYETAGLPMISPSATNPDISGLGKYIWRICMTDAVQGKGLADYTVKDLGLKNVAIMYDDSDYGRGLADAYEAEIKAVGGTVADKEQYTSGDSEFKAQLTKIKGGNPEMIFLSGYYPEGSKIVAQAKELGITAQFLGSDGYASDELAKLGGSAVEGMLVSTFFDYSKQDPKVQAFVTAFKAKYNSNPDWFAANSYDVIMLATQAAKNAGSNDRTAINDALGKIGEYEGISGEIKFDQNGDVIKPLSIVMVKDGQLVTAPKQPTEQ